MATTSDVSAKATELAELSLEELSNIEITSVSKHTERLLDAPASIFVITGEDIRRSGVNTLPEALRLAPNLEVARVGASSYAISARGFSSTTANKLLVLVDGRAVYTPLYSGVFWDAQDVMLEDVERIEVISGPGATLWGANAVNGVINVITKSASQTRGGLATVGGGNQERGYGLRYGGSLGADGAYRVYGKSFGIDHTSRANGSSVHDGWDKGQVGFRADWGNAANGFTLQGDAYQGTLDQTTTAIDAHIAGGNLLARWNRDLDGGGHFQWQAYYDSVKRSFPGAYAENLDTYDFEFLHTLVNDGSHGITWGGGYRSGDDRVTNSAALAFLPAQRSLHWGNLFVQDEITLRGEALRLTVGGKLASNPYTGTEFLPSLRLAWKPEPSRLVWGALSRAVRAPSRIDRDFFAPGTPPFSILAGGPDFVSEIVKVAELGYRAQPSPRVVHSVSLYHNRYDRLRSIEPMGTPFPFVLANKMQGTTTGIEAWGSFQATDNWRLSAGGFVQRQNLRMQADSRDPTGVKGAGNDPRHQWTLRSSHDLPDSAQLDVSLRHVGSLPNPAVPAYTAVDFRYARHLLNNLEVSLVAQDLFDRSHPEFNATPLRSEIERSLYLKLAWTY